MPLSRIIPVEDLPSTLWDGRVVYLPPSLASAYRDVVHHHGLLGLASARDPNNPPVGGVTEDDARKHFAQAFDGSSARAALALLDPKLEVRRVADGLATLFSGGRVAVLDIPCGAGAFFLSVLSAVAELREKGIVPRQPLDVLVVGGDINDHATKFAAELVQRVVGGLERQAIFVQFASAKWNVCDDVSTAELIKQFLGASGAAERAVVVVSNFSGFLKSSGNWDKAEPQLKSVFLFCAGEKNNAIWIEPRTRAATETLVKKVLSVATKKWPRFMRLFGRVPDAEAQEQTEAPFALPLRPGTTCTARLAVMRFELGRPAP